MKTSARNLFKGKVKQFEKPDPKHKALVKIVKSDKDGKFRCELAPGEYTVVAVIGGRMYLNLVTFDGKNSYWITVRVREGKWTTVNIEDTSEAAF